MEKKKTTKKEEQAIRKSFDEMEAILEAGASDVIVDPFTLEVKPADGHIIRLFGRIRGLNLGEPAPQFPPGPFLGLLSPPW